MRRLSIVVLLVSFMSSGVFASNDWSEPGGYWSYPNGWSQGYIPTVDEEVKVRGDETVCTLNTGTGDWGIGQRLRVYEGAMLLIEDGARLLGAGWMRVGAGNPGYVEQTGGLVRLQPGKDSARLGIGDSGGSDGHYTISDGTITYIDSEEKPGSQLIVGARGGTGILTIIGIEPSIQMDELIVGDRAGASGNIEFQVGASGVSPIGLDSAASLDPEGDESTANLLVSAVDTPPMADILLVDLSGDGSVDGVFDTVNGNPAVEGAQVVLSFNGLECTYNLTYVGGTGNDIVLEFESSAIVPVDPGTDNLVHSYTFEDGTANDSVGEAHGTLVGGAAVVDGALVTTAQDQWMEMPGDIIAMNTFDEVTIEAWYASEAGANTGWSMLAYFGDSVNGLGSNGFLITTARADDKSRAAISCGDIATPWASETGADGPEYDDGLLHHMVSTIDATDITLYIDGELIASTPLAAHNSISGISQNFAYLAKGGYDGDPEWIGSIEEFNIYNKALSASEVLFLASQ